jgi:GGDEF domain-containing protein
MAWNRVRLCWPVLVVVFRVAATAIPTCARDAAAATGALPLPTSSYGISTYGEQAVTLDDLLLAAYEALYRAKAQGRDRSETSDRLEPETP